MPVGAQHITTEELTAMRDALVLAEKHSAGIAPEVEVPRDVLLHMCEELIRWRTPPESNLGQLSGGSRSAPPGGPIDA